MKPFRHHMVALLLIFCLPAQSLAVMLIACQQHQEPAAASSHLHSQPDQSTQAKATPTEPTPDCHGASDKRLASGTHIDVAHTNHSDNADNSSNSNCFHCSGACQNLKPLSLMANALSADLLASDTFPNFEPATASGVHGNPARPPSSLLLFS